MDWQYSTSFSVEFDFEPVALCQVVSAEPDLLRSVVSERTKRGFMGPSNWYCYQTCHDSNLMASACLTQGVTIGLQGFCWPISDGSYFKLRFGGVHSDLMHPACFCSGTHQGLTWVACGCSVSWLTLYCCLERGTSLGHSVVDLHYPVLGKLRVTSDPYFCFQWQDLNFSWDFGLQRLFMNYWRGLSYFHAGFDFSYEYSGECGPRSSCGCLDHCFAPIDWLALG